jgi:hypothetical protein
MDEKKKRGRKPKEAEEPQRVTDGTTEGVEKKKRGRKPKSVYNVNETPNTVQTSLSDDENVIVRLHVNDNDSDDDDSSDNQPCA